MVADEREGLIRQAFELERDFFYAEFRRHHWNLPDIVATCPDPAFRERMLQGFWNQDAEKRFPEYRAAVAGLTTAELAAERDRWIEKLKGTSAGRLPGMPRETSRKRPANDNKKGLDR